MDVGTDNVTGVHTDHDVGVVVLALHGASKLGGVPRLDLARSRSDQLRFGSCRMPSLPAPLVDLPIPDQDPVERRHRPQIDALVEQPSVDLQRGQIHELRAVHRLKDPCTLGIGELIGRGHGFGLKWRRSAARSGRGETRYSGRGGSGPGENPGGGEPVVGAAFGAFPSGLVGGEVIEFLRGGERPSGGRVSGTGPRALMGLSSRTAVKDKLDMDKWVPDSRTTTSTCSGPLASKNPGTQSPDASPTGSAGVGFHWWAVSRLAGVGENPHHPLLCMVDIMAMGEPLSRIICVEENPHGFARPDDHGVLAGTIGPDLEAVPM